MRNDTASVLLSASRRALHAALPRIHSVDDFNNGIVTSFTHESEVLSEVDLIRVSLIHRKPTPGNAGRISVFNAIRIL